MHGETFKAKKIREKNRDSQFGEKFYKDLIKLPGLDIGPKNYGNPYGLTCVDLDYPGYDGVTLPFETSSQETVYSSHCLEHIEDWAKAINEWWRVLKIGGHLIVTVPHQYLYEKKKSLPSNFNKDHKRLYTPWLLMNQIEFSLPGPNTWRLVYLRDCDEDFDYSIGPKSHSKGRYEIECVIKKITRPNWSLC